jgi:hypothetical protein
MQLTTSVRRRDFLVFRLSSLLFPGFIFWFNVLCAALIAWIVYRADQPTILVALACVFYFTLAWLFLLAVNMAAALCEVTFISSLRRGVLGEHRFTLGEDGLLEETNFNRTLHAWSSVDASRKILGALILRAGAGWHIFPRAAFGSSLSRESLLKAINSRKGLRNAS